MSKISLWKEAIRYLGSVRLAMLLLAVIIIACIVGTLAESRFDTSVAQAYCYDAPWFVAWLALLCLNLTCAALVRYPWKAAQTGFVMTHLGIVILLAGAMIGRTWGIEGMVTLRQGDRPVHELTINQTWLQVSSGAASEAARLHLNVRRPTPEKPLHLRAAGIDLQIIDTATAMVQRRAARPAQADGTPAIRVEFRSASTPYPVDDWLWLDDSRQERPRFGPTRLHFVSEPLRTVSQTPSEKPGDAHPPESASSIAEVELRDRYFVFANHPEMNISRPLGAAPTGVQARFVPGSNHDNALDSNGVIFVETEQKTFQFRVEDLIDAPVPLEGTPWALHEIEYFPDFRLQDGRPVSASSKPNNPAVVFEIRGKGRPHDAAGHACNHRPGECSDPNHSCCSTSKQTEHTHAKTPPAAPMRITLMAGQQLRFTSLASEQPHDSVEIQIGQEFSLGLGDWRCVVHELIPEAEPVNEWVPVRETDSKTVTGLRVQLEQPAHSKSFWIALGEPHAVTVREQPVQLTFGYRLYPLGFGIVLDRFEVDRDEGTQTPAGFKSSVRFIKPDGAADQPFYQIWMNNPATYPDVFGAGWLGRSFKFSQASWNPNDLNQTTLQVLRDPGWFFKWTGSLILCAGLFIMFVPQFRRKPDSSL